VFLNQSLEFGAHVQKEFRERVGRKDRGVKQAGYYVISFTTMPSVLVELGFLTNPTEEDFLNSPEGRVEMSDALFRAFRAYRSKYHPDVREVPVAVAPAVSTAPPPVVRGALPAESPVVYRVQILASATRVPKNDARLGGRSDVIEYLRDGMFKYAVGAATTPSAADKLKNDLRLSGFPGCFVVAFQGDSPISMDEARRLTAGNR
jgi:N-acetylmuramoyl-L-alanine amidase